jgi:hypothetical protein
VAKLALDDKKLDRAMSAVTGLWTGLKPHMRTMTA